MGMFDYLQISGLALPEFPDELDINTTTFQTKDIENSLRNFRINYEGQLEVLKQEGEWVDNSEIKFLGAEFRIDKEWWEPYDFTGNVQFYEYYDHSDYVVNCSIDDENYFRFSKGWIEYGAKFLCGRLLEPIRLVDKESPVKRNDAEFQKYMENVHNTRAKTIEKMETYRKDHPTPEQKLIDDIDHILHENFAIQTIDDMGSILNKIEEKIKNHRKKYNNIL